MDQQANDDRLAIGVVEAARRLGISRNSVYSRIRSGELPGIRIGKRYLIGIKALEQFVATGGKGTTP